MEAWRSSNKKQVVSEKSSVSESVGDSSSVTQSAQALADLLAKKMEQEQQEVVQKIQRQKEEAAKRLAQANQELQHLRMVKVNSMEAESKSPKAATKSPRLERKEELQPYTYSKGPLEMNVSFDDSDNESFSPVKGRNKSWTSPMLTVHEDSKRDYKHDSYQTEVERPSTVKISLVESIIGDPNEFEPLETDACVVVEYDSDE